MLARLEIGAIVMAIVFALGAASGSAVVWKMWKASDAGWAARNMKIELRAWKEAGEGDAELVLKFNKLQQEYERKANEVVDGTGTDVCVGTSGLRKLWE